MLMDIPRSGVNLVKQMCVHGIRMISRETYNDVVVETQMINALQLAKYKAPKSLQSKDGYQQFLYRERHFAQDKLEQKKRDPKDIITFE